jgi:uncharacterized repeat protein (TIGR01451 family)
MIHKRLNDRLILFGIIIAVTLAGILYINQAIARSGDEEQTVLFSDDFSGDLSNWSVESGTWNIDQGVLTGYNGWVYAGDTAWTNTEFQVQTFADASVALAFRSTGHMQNEYRLDLYGPGYGPSSGNVYALIKYQNGVFTNLTGGYIKLPVLFSYPSVVKVQISGNYVILYINDQYVAEIYDPDPLSNGRIGLGMVGDYFVKYDDVLVSTLPSIMLLPPDQDKFELPGNVITNTIILENHTGATDNFDLEVLPDHQWITTLTANSVGPIVDGERVSIYARVEIPPEALPGEFDLATILATSVNSPTVYTQTATMNSTAISRKIGYVSGASEGQLALIDTEIHTTIGTIDLSGYSCANPSITRLTPDKSQLYIFCGSLKIIILDTTNNSLIASVDLPGDGNDIVFTQDGAYALVGCPAGQVFVIDAVAHEIVKTIPTLRVVSITSHPYLPLVYLAGFEGGNTSELQIIDTSTFSVKKTIAFEWEVYDILPSQDGKWLFVSAMNHQPYVPCVYKLDAQTLQTVHKLSNIGYQASLQIAPDNTRLFVSSPGFGSIQVIDTTTWSPVTSIDIGYPISEMDVTSDGSEMFVLSQTYQGGAVVVIDTVNYTIPYQIFIPGSYMVSLAISPQVSDIYMRKTVSSPVASPGGLVNYEINLMNFRATDLDSVEITDTLPLSLAYLAGTLKATSGSPAFENGVIKWTGSISEGNEVDINFRATVLPSVIIGTSITNTAVISSPAETFTRSIPIKIVQNQVFMPCMKKPCPPSFIDDFSKTNSDWPIEGDGDYSMGYVNGEYFIAVNPGWIAWALQDFGAINFRVEVDAHPTYNLEGGMGIMFGATENGFYYYEINDGWFSLWRVDTNSWTWTPLIDWTASSALYPGYKVNRLQVVRIGSIIKLYANGQIIGTVNDGSYRGSWLGMATEAWSAYFEGHYDNFILYSGDCIGTEEAPNNLIRTASFDGRLTDRTNESGKP